MPSGAWVLVTDGGGNGQSRSAVAAVRALAAAGYRPAVAVSAPYSLAAASRYCLRRVPVPSWREGEFAAAVRAELAAHQYLTVLPGSDGELLALDRPVEQLVDKVAMAKRATAAGLTVPPSQVFGSIDELIDRSTEISFPAVVKPAVSDPTQPAYRANARGDLAWAPISGSVIVQPFLSEALHSVSGVVWGDRLVASVHQQYLRTWPQDCGTSSAAETVEPDLDLEEGLSRLLSGYQGIFQAQLAGPYLIDINPRIYGSMPLAVAAGANLAAIYCGLLGGREVLFTRARVGVFYRWVEGDVRHVARGLRERRMNIHSALRSLLPRRHAAHSTESLRDPGPMVARLRLYVRSR